MMTGPTASRISLAVLDLAGTTAKENGAVRRAAMAAVDQVTDGTGIADFDAIFHRSRGGAKTAMFHALLDGDRDRADAAHKAFEAELERLIRTDHIQPMPGVAETFARLRELDIKIALATGFSPRLRQILLEHLGWDGAIDLALSPEDAGRGRPYPDVVLTAILRLRIDAVQNVATAGDTVNDLLAGTRAGASIVAGVLTGAHDRAALQQVPHTHILAAITGLPAVVEQDTRSPRRTFAPA